MPLKVRLDYKSANSIEKVSSALSRICNPALVRIRVCNPILLKPLKVKSVYKSSYSIGLEYKASLATMC